MNSSESGDKKMLMDSDSKTKGIYFNSSDAEGLAGASQLATTEVNALGQNKTSSPLNTPLNITQK